MRPLFVVATGFVFLALAGCGDNSSSSGPVPLPEEKQSTFTAEQIVDALKLTKDPNSSDDQSGDPAAGLWDQQHQCTVSVVLTSPDLIDTYASAGDTVASNPDRTAGVKVGIYAGADEAECHRVFTERLAVLIK